MAMVSECPGREVLERLLLGKVAHPEADALEEHLADCPQCARALAGLNADDGLVAAMRQARDRTDANAEAAEALIPWLKRLQRKGATEDVTLPPTPMQEQTLDAAPTGPASPPTACVLAAYDFMAPPKGPDEIGRLKQYRVLQAIGVGGMGMVFLAEDTRLRRQVALKVIKPELLERQDLHERFLTEARAIAAVEHDNIVVIYEAGDAGSIPYLVMPLLRGESLEDCLKRADGPLPTDEILRIGREIAAGLEAAHRCGLVHRDIKPSNLWLEGAGSKQQAASEPTAGSGATAGSGQQAAGSRTSVVANQDQTVPGPDLHGPPPAADGPLPAAGHPPSAAGCPLPAVRVKILDFGLARTLDATNDEGERRAILGTPAYMSPEQGRGLPADARSDLFSLGCVMYRMATGRAPFQGRDVVTTLMSVATQTPVSPRELNPKLPTDLAALIEKLLAKKPEDRFASAQAVVDAIGQIERRRQPRKVGRWLTALAACVGLAIAGSLAVSAYLHRPPPPVEVAFEYDEPDAALVLQRDDEPAEEIDVKQMPRKLLAPGTYLVRTKADYAERKLSPASFVVNPGEPRVVPLRLVGLIRAYHNHTLPITAVAFSPRQDSPLALTASKDRSVGVWKTQADDAGLFLPHDSWVHSVAFSPDGKLALTGSGMRQRRPDNSVRLWDLDAKLCLHTFAGHESSVTAVAFDPQGKTLLSGDMDGKIFFWDAQTHQQVDAIQGHDRLTVRGLAFRPDGQQALSAGGAELVLWDVEKRQAVKRFAGHTQPITGVSIAPDGKRAATSSQDGTIRVWDLQTGAGRVIAGLEKGVECIAYAPDGKRLLTGGADGAVRLWNAQTGDAIHVFAGHRKTVHGVAFSADGRRALSGSADLSLRLCELP